MADPMSNRNPEINIHKPFHDPIFQQQMRKAHRENLDRRLPSVPPPPTHEPRVGTRTRRTPRLAAL